MPIFNIRLDIWTRTEKNDKKDISGTVVKIKSGW